VALSYSDSDLGALAAGWRRARDSGEPLPALRLANIVALRHPVSVDTYIDDTLTEAKAILVRLIGGEAYWAYGLRSLHSLAVEKNIALAILPADGRHDERLEELSTVPASTLKQLDRLCTAGGAVAAQAALAQLALAAGIYVPPVIGDKNLPDWGFYLPDGSTTDTLPDTGDKPLVLISFYRAYLTAADTSPIDALMKQFADAGFAAIGVFAGSLKKPGFGDWLAANVEQSAAAVVNATAFSARNDEGQTPFDQLNCPVFQVSLSTARREAWAEAERGLSPADLAMHVVLPEVDGRLFTSVVSFKQPEKRDKDLQYSRFAHRADLNQVANVVAQVQAWHKLSGTAKSDRKLALLLSTYPGRAHQLAHAVGLDALASSETLLDKLSVHGYSVGSADESTESLGQLLLERTLAWPLADYAEVLKTLPQSLQQDLHNTWGDPESDSMVSNGQFRFAALRRGNVLIALQPERGNSKTREDDYHDLSRTPRHGYVAFYLWLQAQQIDGLIHMGAHGTLEWMPGKSVALSPDCWPRLLLGGVPVVYPFIVNDPGEAAQAKRRLGAATIGHLPPPLKQSEMPESLLRLESLLDEYSTADGLDPARRDRLISNIRDEADAGGVSKDLGLAVDACPAEAMTRIDRFVCDIKESQFGEGLHTFGTGDYGTNELQGVLTALDGQHVAPGPSGSPARGRQDVLPTGRNLFSVDPRAVPSRAAHAQGVKLAEEFIRKYLQDNGDWPKGLVIDLWGSATMRTAGEEFSMAMHLAGLSPTWDDNSGRVNGIEVIPLMLLERPRIDVTLRVSGLFRDVFPGLAQLFETGVAALVERDELPEDSPYDKSTPRVFGPRPGDYGLGMEAAIDEFTDEARQAAGEAWIRASSWAIGSDGQSRENREALEQRLLSADSFVHAQDLPESDLLLATDYAAHEAGFAAALARVGAAEPKLYHLDATQPDRPRARGLGEEIARVVHSRAANPQWIDSMMNHGFRGAAEIAGTLEHMAAFAHLAGVVPAHLFDKYHEATLGRDDVREFMQRENPTALAAMEELFRRLDEADLWSTRRNSVRMALLESGESS
ncbi:MAG: cobaltochelatase subunit CobN, partial [Pseudomonadota bacterium]